MPLRDHFRGPGSKMFRWETVHLTWPTMIVAKLGQRLPPEFIAAPGAHQGSSVAVDVAAYERDVPRCSAASANGSEAEPWAPGEPSIAVAAALPAADEDEVCVYDDTDAQRQLVAAVELVSPANKDLPHHRRAFAAKCAALLGPRFS